MSIPLFFAENIAAAEGPIELDEESSRHIVQVLRMKPGERISLTDGNGNSAIAEILSAHKKHCTASPVSAASAPRKLPQLTIAISLTKNTGRFEWFLEKATELGTAAIIPMICARTEKQHTRRDRLISICRSAMLQSSQVWMPAVTEPLPFKNVIATASRQQKLFGYISPGAKRLHHAIDATKSEHLIVIGPEGDFSEEEIDMAKSSGFEGVSFGGTILRVETAGMYAAVVHAAVTSQ